MSKQWFDDVLEFRRAVGLPVGTTPTHLPADASVTVIREEYAELIEAMEAGDLAQIAKESCDLIVTVIGNCQRLGIDLGPVWDAVHGDNMAKVGGPVRQDGKRLKPPGFVPTPIAPILDRQLPIPQVATLPEAERMADEWIERNKPEPAFWQCTDGWSFWDIFPRDAADDLPPEVFGRLSSHSEHEEGSANYPTKEAALADLRQALASLYRDGITPPELVAGEF